MRTVDPASLDCLTASSNEPPLLHRVTGFLVVAALLHALTVAAWAAPAQADTGSGLIELALDEPARITLEEVKLKDAIQQIWDQTGVKIVMPPSAMDLVPYGDETIVELVDIADTPLRQALTQMFAPLGMTFVVRKDAVEIVPKEPLRCLGRRATWDELDTLTYVSAMNPGVNPQALSELQSRVQFKVPVADGWDALSLAIKSVGAGPGDEVLSVACANLGWAWCISDQRVVITSASSLISEQLKRLISLRMHAKPLIDVLQEVGRSAGVSVRLEPGSLRSLPLQIRRNFSLDVHQKPAEEVLEAVSAYTGLGYLIEPDGVLFYQTSGGRPATGQPEGAPHTTAPGDPYVGKIVKTLEDGSTVEWLIRRSELPPDLRQRRDKDLEKAFDELRSQNAE